MHILEEIRCPGCNRKLMHLDGYAQVKCPKCRALVEVDTDTRKYYIKKEHQK